MCGWEIAQAHEKVNLGLIMRKQRCMFFSWKFSACSMWYQYKAIWYCRFLARIKCNEVMYAWPWMFESSLFLFFWMTIFESFWMTIFIFLQASYTPKWMLRITWILPYQRLPRYNHKNFTIKLENIYVEFYELFVALF